MSTALLLMLLAGKAGAQEVSMQSLLREMVDRESLAEFRDEALYRTLQASSYNRASMAPDQPGWFADSMVCRVYGQRRTVREKQNGF